MSLLLTPSEIDLNAVNINFVVLLLLFLGSPRVSPLFLDSFHNRVNIRFLVIVTLLGSISLTLVLFEFIRLVRLISERRSSRAATSLITLRRW